MNQDNKKASNNENRDVEEQSKARKTEEEIKSNGDDEESESAGFSPTDENSVKQIFAKLSNNIEECNKNFSIVNKNITELNNNVRLLILLLILNVGYCALSRKR